MKRIVHTEQSSERELFGVRFLCEMYGTGLGAACVEQDACLGVKRAKEESCPDYNENGLLSRVVPPR